MQALKSWMTALSAALVLTLSLAACGDDGLEEEAISTAEVSGNVVTQDMQFADFTSVEASNAFVVDISRSDSFSVTIRVDDSIADLLDVSKEGDTLRIGLKRATRTAGLTLEASITMPELNGLDLSGTSKATVSGFRGADRLDIKASGASTVDGDLEADATTIDALGASTVTLEGSTAELSVEASGASKLELADFTATTAEVTLSGASGATLNVEERIDSADVSGASRLRYLGDPDLGDVTTTGASTMDKVED